MANIGRNEGRIPVVGVILALLLGGLLIIPVLARADSASSTSAPFQYRGPSNEVPRGGAAFLDVPAGGDAARSPDGWARWEFWFEYGKDALLRDALATPRGGTLTGPGFPAPGAPGYDPLRPEDIDERALPALRAALRDPAPEVRVAALLALGNARDVKSLPALEDAVARGSRTERRAAALALGFLGDAGALPALRKAMGDPDAEVRSMAILGSGLLGNAEAAPGVRGILDRALENSGSDARQTRVAAVTALGLLGDRASVQVLVRVLASRTLRDDRLRAHAAIAIGRVAEPAGQAPLLAALKNDSDASVRRAAALALGSFKEKEVAVVLTEAVGGDSDALVRGFAAISLARSAGPAAVEFLAERTDIRWPRSLRGFAAVALGLTDSPRTAAPPLRALLDLRSEDSLRGAASIALGLLGDRDSSARMMAVARDRSSSPELKGYALLGSALTGDPQVTTQVSAALHEGGPPELLRGAALAAGVRPFPGSPALLFRILIDARDPTVRGAAILGLGLAPDRGTVPLLADFLVDGEGAAPMQRVQASTALGQLVLGGALPAVARLSDGIDHRSLTEDLAAATRLF